MGKAIIIEPLAGTITAPNGATAPTAASDLGNDWIGVQWTSTIASGSDAVDMDFGVATTFDTVAILSANFAAATWFLAAGATQGASTYDSGPNTFQAGFVVPTSVRTNALIRTGSPVTFRWLRVWLTDLTSFFQAGRLVVGKAIAPAYNFSFGAAFGVRDLGGGDFSPQGVWLPRPGAKLRTIGLSFTRATKQEIEELISPLLERVGNGKFVLVITDPDVADQRQRRMYYGPLTGDLSMVWATAAGFEWRANLTSVI
jgi:hypothetical protein